MHYLAGPYTHKNELVRQLRYQMLSKISARLLLDDTFIFSPITHGHAIEAESGLQVPYEKWLVHGLCMLEKCDIMFLAKIPGWKESKGVQIEIAFAKQHNIPIQPIDGDSLLMDLVGVELYNQHLALLLLDADPKN